MHIREHFKLVHQRSGMYGLDGSYGQFCAYLLGYDEGTSRSLLFGFDEWLRLRFHGQYRPTNVVWSGLILWLTFEECWRSAPLWADPTAAVYELDLPAGIRTDPWETNDQVRRAVEMLFRLLDEFFALREQRDGLTKIFTAYIIWLGNEPDSSSSPESISQRIFTHLNDEFS